jgi:hypothetical protein
LACEVFSHWTDSIGDEGELAWGAVKLHSPTSLHIGIRQWVSREKAGTGRAVEKIEPGSAASGSARFSLGIMLFCKHYGAGFLSTGVTIQECPICFVIGLLMYEPVHFADLFLAYGALLKSYNA